MQRDLAAGSNSEFDVLVAYPMTLVAELNLSAPVLTQCYEKIKQLCLIITTDMSMQSVSER